MCYLALCMCQAWHDGSRSGLQGVNCHLSISCLVTMLVAKKAHLLQQYAQILEPVHAVGFYMAGSEAVLG